MATRIFLLFLIFTALVNVCSASITYSGGSEVVNTTLIRTNISELSDVTNAPVSTNPTDEIHWYGGSLVLNTDVKKIDIAKISDPTNAPKSNNPTDEIHWYGGSLVLDTALGEKPYPPDINVVVVTPSPTPITTTPEITETPSLTEITPTPTETTPITTTVTPKIEEKEAGGKAILNIDSEPKGVEVYLNGKFYGRTPAKIEVEPKKYTIELYKEGYEVYTYELMAESNKEYTLYVTMKKEQPKRYDPTFGGKFLEPPTVTLHLVKDRFKPGEQGIIELSVRNPNVNDIALMGELNVKVPSNLAVEGGDVVGGGGYYSSTFIAKPGTSRTQTLYITCLDAEPGRYLIHAKVYYYPEGNRENYQEISLTKPIVVETPPPIPLDQEYIVIIIAIVVVGAVAIAYARRKPPQIEIREEE